MIFIFSSFFRIVYMSVLFFLSLFNYFYLFKLMNFANSIEIASSLSLLFVFVVAAYDSIAVVILLMFCLILLNLLFIFLNFTFIVFFTINVNNNTTTRRNNDNCKFDSIMFTILSRSKICVFFFIWTFRLNKNKSVQTFYVFATSSRRLLNDDITLIFTNRYALMWYWKRDYTNVYKAFQTWLLYILS